MCRKIKEEEKRKGGKKKRKEKKVPRPGFERRGSRVRVKRAVYSASLSGVCRRPHFLEINEVVHFCYVLILVPRV